ncbi:MAG: hypothetical protein LBT38_04675 [Deltaproteobacteria bacterium]|jgi:hypothetical protein|nr:hypothetical protein [Deltaproteobacteria bacterium]
MVYLLMCVVFLALIACISIFSNSVLADENIQHPYKWIDVAHKLALNDPYGARDLMTYYDHKIKIVVNSPTGNNPTGIISKINCEIYKKRAITAKGLLAPDIIYEYQSEEKGQIFENFFIIEQQHARKTDFGQRAHSIMARINEERKTGNIGFLAIFTGDSGGVTHFSRNFISGGSISINYRSINVKDLDLGELRNDKRIFSLILLADRLFLASSELREEQEANAMEVLNRVKILAKELNLEISRFSYITDFVYRLFIATDEELVDNFKEVYKMMGVLSPSVSEQKLWADALKTKAARASANKAREEMALKMIEDRFSDEFIINYTGLSERHVKGLRKRISSSSSPDKSE